MPVWNEVKFLPSTLRLTINLVRGGLQCLHSLTLPGADLNVIETIIISLWECRTVEFYAVVCEAVLFSPTSSEFGSQRYEVSHVHKVECVVPWLNDALVFFTVSLQLCQQLKDKVMVLKKGLCF